MCASLSKAKGAGQAPPALALAPADEQHAKLMTVYDEKVKQLVALKFDLIKFRLQLDERNRILNSKEWPSVEELQRELGEIDEKIRAFKERTAPFLKLQQEFEDGIIAIQALNPVPHLPEAMAIHDMDTACKLELLSLKLEKRDADLKLSSAQITKLFFEVQKEIDWIVNHPRKLCEQRVARRESGQTSATQIGSVFDRAARHLLDYLPGTAKPTSSPKDEDAKDQS